MRDFLLHFCVLIIYYGLTQFTKKKANYTGILEIWFIMMLHKKHVHVSKYSN